MEKRNSRWGYSMGILLFSIIAFLVFKLWLPDEIFPEIKLEEKSFIVVDEWMQEALKDTKDDIEDDSFAEDIVKIDTLAKKVKSPADSEEFRQFSENLENRYYLDHFYNQLLELENNPETKKVRIAYFGDSMTDGDLIVQDIRMNLQNIFGGRGVGFVPITSESARSRASIIHHYSKEWRDYSFMKKYDTVYPYGVNGHVFYTDSTGRAKIDFKAGVNRKNNNMPFPILYYGKSENDSASVIVTTLKDTLRIPLEPVGILNRSRLSHKILSAFTFDFENAQHIPFYGINFDVPYGIQVDNFSSRGNSGLPLTALNRDLIHTFQKELNYDLIVLHFGTNVLDSNSFTYEWYKNRMKRVVDYVRSIFPEASVMVISIADRSKKYDTQMKTDSAVTFLLHQQRLLAEEKKTAFINLFDIMGGENSMVSWVETEKPKANKDYTHFNSFGSGEIANLISDQILKGFENYKIKRRGLEEKKKAKHIKDSVLQTSKDTFPNDSKIN